MRGGFRPGALSELDIADAEYQGDRFSIALCPRCENPFLIRESLFGIGDFETVTEEKVLYPPSERLPLEHVPAVAQKAYEQAVRALSTGLYEASTLMCRKTLEAVCKLKGASGRTLYERLSALKEQGVIDARLIDWAHEIRAVGNDAAHDSDGDVSVEDARDVLDFTEAILLYVFSFTVRFEQFRSRRARR